jgi:hypothetical protein
MLYLQVCIPSIYLAPNIFVLPRVSHTGVESFFLLRGFHKQTVPGLQGHTTHINLNNFDIGHCYRLVLVPVLLIFDDASLHRPSSCCRDSSRNERRRGRRSIYDVGMMVANMVAHNGKQSVAPDEKALGRSGGSCVCCMVYGVDELPICYKFFKPIGKWWHALGGSKKELHLVGGQRIFSILRRPPAKPRLRCLLFATL